MAKKKQGTGWKEVCKMVQDENKRLRDELAEAQADVQRLRIELYLIAPMLKAQRSDLFNVTAVTYTNPPATVDHVTPKKKG